MNLKEKGNAEVLWSDIEDLLEQNYSRFGNDIAYYDIVFDLPNTASGKFKQICEDINTWAKLAHNTQKGKLVHMNLSPAVSIDRWDGSGKRKQVIIGGIDRFVQSWLEYSLQRTPKDYITVHSAEKHFSYIGNLGLRNFNTFNPEKVPDLKRWVKNMYSPICEIKVDPCYGEANNDQHVSFFRIVAKGTISDIIYSHKHLKERLLKNEELVLVLSFFYLLYQKFLSILQFQLIQKGVH